MTNLHGEAVAANSRAIVITEIEAMGGAERCCLALSRWLHERGMQHHFVTYCDHIGLGSYASHPIQVVQLRPRMRPWNKAAALGRHLRGIQSRYQPLQSGYQPALHATLAGLRGFHTLMHDTPSLFTGDERTKTVQRRLAEKTLHRVLALGLRSGGRTVVASSYLQQETAEVFGVAADLLPIGGQPHASSFHLRPVAGSLRMLSVSRVASNKRLDWVIRALARLERGTEPLSSKINWSFDIVGEGPQLAELKQMVENLDLADRVRLHGYLSDDALKPVMDRAQLMLIPARQGYGIPALEALQSGMPLLLHRDSGVSDLLLQTPWATIVEGSEPDLEAGLNKAIEGVRRGLHLNAPLPYLPTEDEWAEKLVVLCGWR